MDVPTKETYPHNKITMLNDRSDVVPKKYTPPFPKIVEKN
jgi:hypothetical protein